MRGVFYGPRGGGEFDIGAKNKDSFPRGPVIPAPCPAQADYGGLCGPQPLPAKPEEHMPSHAIRGKSTPGKKSRCLLAGLLAGLLALLLAWGAAPGLGLAAAPGVPPLRVDILDAQQRKQGRALIYSNYVELTDPAGVPLGAVGVVYADGRSQLYLIRSNQERRMVGSAAGRRLFDASGKLIGYYFWTPIWSYVYDTKMKKVGQAQCIAYQGVCAAGVAGYLLGLIR